MFSYRHPRYPFIRLPAPRPKSLMARRLMMMFWPQPKRPFVLDADHRRLAMEVSPYLSIHPLRQVLQRLLHWNVMTGHAEPEAAVPLCANELWMVAEMEADPEDPNPFGSFRRREPLRLRRGPVCICGICLSVRAVNRNPFFRPIMTGRLMLGTLSAPVRLEQ